MKRLQGVTPRGKNYWLDTVTMPAVPPLPLPAKVDVAVVGAGFTGLSAARTLARRGARVAVVEAETIGWGASSRNGGMVLTGTKLSVETLIARYGLDKARQMYAASLAAIACVEQIVREEAVECDFGRCGHLEVACKASHFEGFSRSAELLAHEFNHTLRLLPRDELRSEVGSAVYFGGLLDETSAGVNPARYLTGLAYLAFGMA